jgi:hypothetical protein
MARGIASNSSLPNQTVAQLPVMSYDSGYEHSIDHYVDIKLLVQETHEEANGAPATFAAAS